LKGFGLLAYLVSSSRATKARLVIPLIAISILTAAPGFAETTHYRYDALGRLVHVAHSTGAQAGETTKLIYDDAGNRVNYTAVQVMKLLAAGQSIYSPDNRFQLAMQPDGNLVLYMGTRPLWHTYTYGSGADRAAFQADGNLVIYTGSTPVWSSATFNHPGAEIYVQNDGNLVIYDAGGIAIWSSGTCCH